MLKKLFHSKQKQHDPLGRQSISKIAIDPASAAILSRPFSPLHSRVDSPSDLLTVVGYPLTNKDEDCPSPLDHKPKQKTYYQLTVRNVPSPVTTNLPPIDNENHIKMTTVTETDSQHVLLLETSREDKTLVEKGIIDEAELNRLHQKILEFEHERKLWHQKLQWYIDREEQMNKIIQQNQIKIYRLQYSQSLSDQALSIHSSRFTDDEEIQSYIDNNECYFAPNYPYYYYDHYRKRYVTSSYPLWHRYQEPILRYYNE